MATHDHTACMDASRLARSFDVMYHRVRLRLCIRPVMQASNAIPTGPDGIS